MSADNGIYILRTSEGQNRVIHAQAIENIYWDDELKGDVNKPVSKQLLRYFGNSRYTYDKSVAFEIVNNMAKHTHILEYGILTIEVDKTWKEIVKEANLDLISKIIE